MVEMVAVVHYICGNLTKMRHKIFLKTSVWKLWEKKHVSFMHVMSPNYPAVKPDGLLWETLLTVFFTGHLWTMTGINLKKLLLCLKNVFNT